MKSRSELMMELASLEKGIYSAVMLTEKDALKRSRKSGEPTPGNLQTIKKVTVISFSLGNEYESEMKKRLVKEGFKDIFKHLTKNPIESVNAVSDIISGMKFESQGTYCYPVTTNLAVWKHKDRDVYYLRVYPDLAKSQTISKHFDSKGNEIENWKEVEEEYFPMKKSSGPVAVCNYSLDAVKMLVTGVVDLKSIDMTALI